MAQESSNVKKVAQSVPGTDADSDDDRPLVPTKVKTAPREAEDDDDIPLVPTNAPSAARSAASFGPASAAAAEKKTASRKRPREHKTALPKEKKAKSAAGGLSCPHSTKIDAAEESKNKCCGCGARACEPCRKQWARCECDRRLCLKCKSASRWRCAGSGCDVYFGACKNYGSLTLSGISHNCRMCFEVRLCVNCLIECEGYCAACERGVDMILGGLNG